MSASVLRIEIDELKNAIRHLERSNRELKELLQTDPDPEYRLAVGENITTIAKKRARVALLEEELRRLTGEDYTSDAVGVPVSEDASPAGADEDTAAPAPASVTAPSASVNGGADARTHPDESSPSNMETDNGQADSEALPGPGQPNARSDVSPGEGPAGGNPSLVGSHATEVAAGSSGSGAAAGVGAGAGAGASAVGGEPARDAGLWL